jgi:hypothetical protein
LAGAYLVYSDGSEALVFTDVSSGNESVATATQGGLPAWTTIAAQNLGSTQITWQSGPAISDLQGDMQNWTTEVAVQVAQCFAQLKYRTVNFMGVPTTFNHSFWWIQTNQTSSAPQYVTDAGPSGTCPLSCGYLVDWVVAGSTGHYPEDNPNASLAWSSGASASVCSAVTNLYSYAVNWPQTMYQYAIAAAPNSNTFAHWAGNDRAVLPDGAAARTGLVDEAVLFRRAL